MSDLFALAANEGSSGSAFFLSSLFGTVGNVLPVAGGTAGPAFLGTLFQVFNTAVLSLGSLIVTYTTFVSIVMTAHEGEFLGKKFHSMWIPLRTVMGIAALVPTASGYSYLQIGMMWFIIQGIGAADTIWTATVNYALGGGATNAASASSSAMSTANTKAQLAQLFQDLSCQAAAKATDSSGFYCYDNPNKSFCMETENTMLTFPAAGQAYQMGPGGSCGSLTLGTSAQNQALQNIVITLGEVANQLVSVDNSYAAFISPAPATPVPAPSFVQQYCSDNSISPCTKDSLSFTLPSQQNGADQTVKNLYWTYGLQPTAGDFISVNATYYAGAVAAAAAASGSASLAGVPSTTIINNGWIYAGGYYYAIAQTNRSTAPPPIAVTAAATNLSAAAGAHAQVIYTAAGVVTTALNGSSSSSSSSSSSGALPTVTLHCDISGLLSVLNGLCDSLLGGWIDNLSGTGNPVVAAQSYGHGILNTLENAFGIVLGLNLAAGAMSAIIIGTGVNMLLVMTTLTVTGIATFFGAIFLGVGVTLAVYTPLIPYLLFTFGAIGWMTATIETMIAAPLVAIGLLYPEGHDLWGKAEQSFMLILNIFLRPSLMIFGMISGMLMTSVVIGMINFAFMTVAVSVSNGQAGLVETIMFMVVYTSLFTTSIGKCFDLIHLIPDKILRWIGGGGEQFGDSSGGLDKVGGATDRGASKAAEGASSAASFATEAGKSLKRKEKKEGGSTDDKKDSAGKVDAGKK